MLKTQILQFDRLIMAWHRSNQASRQLDDIPGVGPALATALVATVADPRAFRSGRNFSAWIGIVPKQHSSGGAGRSGDQDNPIAPTHCRMRVIDRDLIRGGHYGRRSCEPR